MAELEAALLDQDCFDDCVQDAKRKCDNRGNCKPCCAALKPLSPREEKEAAARLAGHSIANDPQSRQQALPIFSSSSSYASASTSSFSCPRATSHAVQGEAWADNADAMHTGALSTHTPRALGLMRRPSPWRLTVGREEREDGAGVMRRDDALYGYVQTANYSTALYR
jgi:hypothetical protein